MTKENNLWRATATPAPAASALDNDLEVDVAIVGGGILGASAALALSEAGASVAVIEAARFGEGASSRAGGFVVPQFTFGNPRTIQAEMGTLGERLTTLVGGSASAVFGLIKKHEIDCDARQGGWYQPAHCNGTFARIQSVARAWQEAGYGVELLDGAETAARTGVEGYAGSWYAPTGGTLHPLSYTHGLLAAAARHGARLYDQSPVRRIERRGNKFAALAGPATVLADRVLICTNAHSEGLSADLEKSIVRMKIWQAASAPILAAERQHLFHNGESLSDTRANLFTYRFDRDWRLITGAVAAYGQTPQMHGQAMMRRLRQLLRLKETPALQYLWTGTAAVTRSRLPEVVITEDGLVSASTCNGRGIALATVAGEALARAVLAGNFDDLPLPVVKRGPSATVRMQQAVSGFYPYYGRVTDWLDERG